MRILLLSFYFPPDIGPGPLRAKSLVDALVEIAGEDVQIDVITTMPNRYRSFQAPTAPYESVGNVSITRIAVPAHHSGMKDQAISYLSYTNAVFNATRGKQWDVVISTTSRLMTGALGAWTAKRCRANLYLDVRDLFVDTIKDALAHSKWRYLIPIFSLLERWTFRSADKINVVSAGFLSYFKERVPDISPSVYTNGIDSEFRQWNGSTVTHDIPQILYAGNMGDGQGLHHIIPRVAKLNDQVAQFKLIGAGGRHSDLENAISKLGVNNAELCNPVPRHELLNHYHQADVLFLHLNDYSAFQKVLPSKIFEYAATGKPILAGVGGYAAEFLLQEVPGVEIFKPCDVEGMHKGLQKLLAGPRTIDRSDFCVRYDRHELMLKMSRDILKMSLKDNDA